MSDLGLMGLRRRLSGMYLMPRWMDLYIAAVMRMVPCGCERARRGAIQGHGAWAGFRDVSDGRVGRRTTVKDGDRRCWFPEREG
jgi:hypothetical protein